MSDSAVCYCQRGVKTGKPDTTVHKIFGVVSRLSCYISCYIAESRFPLGQCIVCCIENKSTLVLYQKEPFNCYLPIDQESLQFSTSTNFCSSSSWIRYQRDIEYGSNTEPKPVLLSFPFPTFSLFLFPSCFYTLKGQWR